MNLTWIFYSRNEKKNKIPSDPKKLAQPKIHLQHFRFHFKNKSKKSTLSWNKNHCSGYSAEWRWRYDWCQTKQKIPHKSQFYYTLCQLFDVVNLFYFIWRTNALIVRLFASCSLNHSLSLYALCVIYFF